MVSKSTKKRKKLGRIRIATWNVRGLNRVGKQQLICEQMDWLNVNVLGMSETFLDVSEYCLRPTKAKGITYRLLCAGKNTSGRRGVGFLVDERIEILDVCVQSIDVMGIVVGNKILVQVYAPDGYSKKDQIKLFY
jgi:exonuclease III